MDKRILHYLCPVFIQMITAAAIVCLLEKNGIECGYGSVTGIALVIAGGISSALWGCVYQIRYGGRSMKDIVKDFFHIKEDIGGYLLVLLFVALSFAGVPFGGSLNASLVSLVFIFLKSIAFGGIEEIGWRYTFQPCVEKKLSYPAACLVTFVFWGIWHFLFFCVDGSIGSVQVLPFLLGLLMNCFMFSAVYNYKRNLWLCVLAHSLINTFAQTTSGGSDIVTTAARVVILSLSVILCARMKRISDK